MKTQKLILVLFTSILITNSHSQVPTIQWQKALGGTFTPWWTTWICSADFRSGLDMGRFIRSTSDGGSIVVGAAQSTDGDVAFNYGGCGEDYWVVKLDYYGNISWQNTFGGTDYDTPYSITETNDGGYIIVGSSSSTDHDVMGQRGFGDYWVVKLNSYGGMQWSKTYGGSDHDAGQSICQTSDGGYLIGGYSRSNDGDVSGNNGDYDFWIIKISSSGTLLWQKSFGGSSDDGAHSVIEGPYGNYIVTGYTSSNDGDVIGARGSYDSWTLVLDYNGNLLMQKVIGGSSVDGFYSIDITRDGGFILSGLSNSNDGDIGPGGNGKRDCWVVKLGYYLNIEWQKLYGGPEDDDARSIIQTTDNGFIFTGSVKSMGGDITQSQGGFDYWIVKLDNNGNLQWQKSLGGPGSDYAHSVCQDIYGDYIIAGHANQNGGDVTGIHGVGSKPDFWVVKLQSNGLRMKRPTTNTTIPIMMNVYPNPTNKEGFNFNLTGLTNEVNQIQIDIYDLYGKRVYSEQIKHGKGELLKKITPKESFSTGVYLVRVDINGEILQEKLNVR